MITLSDASKLKEQVQASKTVFILLPMNPTYDAIASALSLYLSMKAAGKSVQIACPDDMRVESSYLIGVDEIKKEMGNQNLVVSFQYAEENVEKVSYNISDDGKKFNLIISPKAGGKPLDPRFVDFSYKGASGDLVFIVGATSFEQLGFLYESEKQLFTDAMTVSITPYGTPPFAKLSLETSGQSCIAEGVSQLLSGFDLSPADDTATNLLSSIEHATNRFQSVAVSPETFEVVAMLLRNGARRSATNPAIHPETTQTVPTSVFAEAMRQRKKPQGEEIFQIEHKEQSSMNPPKEWLQPKVFNGGSKV